MRSTRFVRAELANAKTTIERQKDINRRLRERLRINVAKAKTRYEEIQILKWKLKQKQNQ